MIHDAADSESRSLSRRRFLSAGLAAGAGWALGCASFRRDNPLGIIDTHTHFYDPSRPEGVPWPSRDDVFLYRPVLPKEYLALAKPLGIAGTVVVEASSRVADNDWVLDLIAREPFLLGLVGHLKPGRESFASDLRRLSANPRFLGIRTGGWDIPVAPDKNGFVRDIQLLAERGLALDVLGGFEQIPAMVRLAQAAPGLRMVIDHCAGVRFDRGAVSADWKAALQSAAKQPGIFLKVSGLVEGAGQPQAPSDPEFYRPALDFLWETFGEERLIFASNWPVSARFASLETVLGIVRPYFTARGPAAVRKVFRENARRVYRWS